MPELSSRSSNKTWRNFIDFYTHWCDLYAKSGTNLPKE